MSYAKPIVSFFLYFDNTCWHQHHLPLANVCYLKFVHIIIAFIFGYYSHNRTHKKTYKIILCPKPIKNCRNLIFIYIIIIIIVVVVVVVMNLSLILFILSNLFVYVYKMKFAENNKN